MTLIPITLLNSLLSSSRFGGVDFVDGFILVWVNCKKNILLLFKKICIPFFSYIVVLDRASSILLNRHGESGYLVPELRSIQYFTIKCDTNCCFFVYAYDHVDEIPFFSDCFENFFFSWMGVTFCQKCFHINWDVIFFSLILFMWWITTIDLIMQNQPYNPGISSTY